MWNDEDNNPYGSFDRHDSSLSPTLAGRDDSFDRPVTPTSESADDVLANDPTGQGQTQTQRQYGGPYGDDDDDDEHKGEGDEGGPLPRKKKGGYDSRVEQILYEHPELDIVITDAGKSVESGGQLYRLYHTDWGESDLEVRRRYSEFSSLRATLVNLHPTLIIPPIPEKHSMADYAAKPTKAKEDMGIIDLRKRMLGVFLNRCRKMNEVLEDGVWWRFLDPNASWNEVLHSAPVASIPKNNMKAPPLNPSQPTQAHQWLPVPSTNAKLRSNSVSLSSSISGSSGTPTGPSERSSLPSAASHTIPGAQIFGRFPPSTQTLSEQELDPYFTNFEASTRELEGLLQGNIERVNRRTLSHLSALAADMAELGARYNGFSLSEQSPTLAAAIERVGQAVDSSYLATEELASSLGAGFAEPMRESAQFASVVRGVLRYRILKRVQEEMTKDELAKKRALLQSLERSEAEARRIDQYLTASTGGLPTSSPSSPSSPGDRGNSPRRSASVDSSTARGEGDVASIDSDFPPTHAEGIGGGSQPTPPSPAAAAEDDSGGGSGIPRRSKSYSGGGNFVTNKIFGRISHAVHGIVDVDPERTRRDQIGKTKESLVQLEQALRVSEKDVKDASAGVLKDLKRFQGQKEEDLRRYMVAYAKCHIDWARKNLETWREAAEEVGKIEVR